MKRRLIYCPEINPASVVLLFEKGDEDDSWSIRDYSRQGAITLRYANDFNFSLRAEPKRILRSVDAPAVSTNDLKFWHDLTVETNAKLALSNLEILEKEDAVKYSNESSFRSKQTFSLLDSHRLNALPKARKAEDMRRILHSPNSEDWVTWNAFALVQKLTPSTWWNHFVHLARHENPSLTLPDGWEEQPTVSLWRCVPPPLDYEKASRIRMLASETSGWADRARKPGPVEGESEIDITIHNRALTLFVEAKLGSDISARTSYDPHRNQIARNIDCLLDDARGTAPLFWMLVRDAGQGHAYKQLIDGYRLNPLKLAELLPHRSPAVIEKVVQGISIVLWRDFISPTEQCRLIDDEEKSVYQELAHRVR